MYIKTLLLSEKNLQEQCSFWCLQKIKCLHSCGPVVWKYFWPLINISYFQIKAPQTLLPVHYSKQMEPQRHSGGTLTLTQTLMVFSMMLQSLCHSATKTAIRGQCQVQGPRTPPPPPPHPTLPGTSISSPLFYPQEREADNIHRPNSSALTGTTGSESQGWGKPATQHRPFQSHSCMFP